MSQIESEKETMRISVTLSGNDKDTVEHLARVGIDSASAIRMALSLLKTYIDERIAENDPLFDK